jgi:DNA-binding beta-propeller fold protein YncE
VDTPVPQPSAVAVTPDGAFVWVAVPPNKTVRVYSSTAAAVTLVATISLPDTPSGLVMAPDGRRAYVSLPATSQVAVLDVVGKAVAQTVAIPPVLGTPAYPSALAIVDRGANGLTLAVADLTPSHPQLHLLDAGAVGFALTHRATLATGLAAGGLSASMVTVGSATIPRVFAALTDGDRVAVIDPIAAVLSFNWGLGTGLGESLAWTAQPAGAAGLSSTTAPSVELTAKQPGSSLVEAAYTLPPGPGRGQAPYTFEVRLNDSLLASNSPVVLRKEQYDRVMNILDTFHPIGVEVLTTGIRRLVKEVDANQLDVLPEYTYPSFRVRTRAPRKTFPE